MAESPVRVAVVGCGWWATEAHLPSLTANTRARVAGLVDLDGERLARAAAAFDEPPTFRSTGELLAAVGVDAAIVAVPHAAHHAVAAELLDAGVHVLVEKPLTTDPDDARDLVARAADAGVELIVGYPWHYSQQAAAVRDVLRGGELGPLEHVSCLYASTVRELYGGAPRPYPDALGGAINPPLRTTYADGTVAGGGQGQTQVTHAAALLLWCTGLEVEGVCAFTAGLGLAVDVADAIALRFAGGAVGVLSSTGSVLPTQPELLEYRFFARDGDLLWDVHAGRAVVRHADGRRREWLEADEAARYPQEAPARNLVDVALGHAPNGSPASVGVAAVDLVDALYRSAAASGQPTRPGRPTSG